ncbi:hypothetical protein P7C70_g8703, partial [Phenoliferia sp. Uapishka_3]
MPVPVAKQHLEPNEVVQVKSATSTLSYTCQRHEDARVLPSGASDPFPSVAVTKNAPPSSDTIDMSRTNKAGELKEARHIVADVPALYKRKQVVEVLLAKKFVLGGKVDPEGWWISEKLDGIRAYWDGQGALWSRLGNAFQAPKWFIDTELPNGQTLDGELFHSRNNFSEASSIVRSHVSEKWNEMRYHVFDIPSLAHLPFESRMELLNKTFTSAPPMLATKPVQKSDFDGIVGSVLIIVEQTKCKGHEHLLEMLHEIEGNGGEG